MTWITNKCLVQVSSMTDYKKKVSSSGPTKSVSATQSSPTMELTLQRSESVAEDRESQTEPQSKKMPQMKVTYGSRGYGNLTTTAANGGPAAPATWRNFSNPQGAQRGLMEKFFLSRGRLNSPATFNAPSPAASSALSSSSSSTNHSVVTPGSSAGDPVGVINHSNKTTPAPVRYLAPAVKPVELITARRDEVSHSFEKQFFIELWKCLIKKQFRWMITAIKLDLLAAITPRPRRKFSKNFAKCRNERKN